MEKHWFCEANTDLPATRRGDTHCLPRLVTGGLPSLATNTWGPGPETEVQPTEAGSFKDTHWGETCNPGA